MLRMIFLAGLASLVACAGNLETVETTNEFGYTERYQRNKADFARQGLYSKLDPNDVIIEQATYVRDTLDGLRVLFFVSGDTHIVETYQMGRFEGPYREYYEDGTILQTGQYVNNAMEGPWKSYYSNGQLSEEVLFKNNDENGPFKQYHMNGKLKAEGSFLEGDNEHGELRLYNSKGELYRVMRCERGRCETTWQDPSAPENNAGDGAEVEVGEEPENSDE